MLYEPEVLEAQYIADLALEARRVRDRLLKNIRDANLGEPHPSRGKHNPAGSFELTEVSASEFEFDALNAEIASLNLDLRGRSFG